jgi:glycosyltransferase involved in cell wall biosynthesis
MTSATAQEPLTILQVTDLFDPFIGGLEQHVKSLSRELAGRGHEVTVATALIPGSSPADVVDGVAVRRIAGWSHRLLSSWYDRPEAAFHPPVPDPGVVRALKRLIAELRPDVIQAQGWMSCSAMALAGKSSARLVVTLHDYSLVCARKTLLRAGAEPCPGPQLSSCLRCAPGQYGVVKGTAIVLGLRIARSLNKHVDSWIAISQPVLDASRAAIPGDRDIKIIPPASDYSMSAAGRPAWLPPEDGYFMFVGALGRHKGLDWLLETYERGAFDCPLVVIGTPRSDTPHSWPRGVIVRTEVPHDEVMLAWRHAGIGLMPSLWPEPFGLVAVEAMHSGLPVIASRVGGLPDIVADGLTGLLIEPGNTTELMNAMRQLQNSSAMRLEMGRAAAVRAGYFATESVASRYEQHYRCLVNDLGSPQCE